jgi:8-oxo-dGTP diphosphatase
MDKEKSVKVGVGVMIVKDGKMLLGKRKGKHVPGVYAWPGGRMELDESFEECAKREVMEETGMEIENIKFVSVFNIRSFKPDNYVNLTFVADWKSGDPVLKEPDKCEGWGWYDNDNLPEPLFNTIRNSLNAINGGQIFFDNYYG